MRLRRSDCGGPGIRRRRHGRGFVFVDDDTGERIDDAETLQRIHELVIPPAWKDVWVCPFPGGHIQATGIDQAGRKQYLYHQRWRERRDQEKFDDMLEFAGALPALRERVVEALGGERDSRDQVLACAVRLLDLGFFRIGTEDYAVTNETYGLATMKKAHVTVSDGAVVFDYPAKHGKQHVRRVVDEDVAAIVARLKARRGGIDELLAYKEGRRWRDVKSADINAWLKGETGLDIAAKDFRTWNATVIAAVTLAASSADDLSPTKRKRLITHAVKQVAHYLGNTPAVARSAYIDPRVFDRFRDGRVIPVEVIAADEDATAIQGPTEAAVIELLSGRGPAPARRRRSARRPPARGRRTAKAR